MKNRLLILGIISSLAALASACEPPTPVKMKSAEAEAEAEARSFHYSPFVVQVPESEMVFGTISFKDVGLARTSKDPSDPMLEAIAQAVSYEIQLDPSLAVGHTLVEYDEEILDPANHTFCEERHLYVDVWNGDDKWGYSLWAGCGEQDNFAWKEVSIPEPDAELTDKVGIVGNAITRSLVDAHAKSCYQKSCSCAYNNKC